MPCCGCCVRWVCREALCGSSTHTGALDVADLCVVERRPVLDYMAQFQALCWITKQASALNFRTVLKHTMKTARGLPRTLSPTEISWTLYANSALRLSTPQTTQSDTDFGLSSFIIKCVNGKESPPPPLSKSLSGLFLPSAARLTIDGQLAFTTSLQSTSVKAPQCFEMEWEKYWSCVWCRCNLCWCSSVQQCETTLRQQRDVWPYCWHHWS